MHDAVSLSPSAQTDQFCEAEGSSQYWNGCVHGPCSPGLSQGYISMQPHMADHKSKRPCGEGKKPRQNRPPPDGLATLIATAQRLRPSADQAPFASRPQPCVRRTPEVSLPVAAWPHTEPLLRTASLVPPASGARHQKRTRPCREKTKGSWQARIQQKFERL